MTEREKAVLTEAHLRVEKAGRVEEVPLDRSKTLRGFALSFPALLRGDEKALAATFDLRLEGDPKASWTLTMWPKDAGLCSFLRRIEVTGEGAEVKRLVVEEVSGDVTDTRFGATVRDVPAAELDAAFGAR